MNERWFVILKTVAFMFFSILLLGTVVVFLGKERHIFKKTFILKARFHSVAGLSPQSPVYRYGVRVGSVGECRFLPDGKVEVVMDIEEEYHSQFRRGCYARIVPVGILGDKAIDIVGGELKEAILASGSTIDSEEPFDFNDLAENIKPLLRDAGIIAHNLADITTKISQEHQIYRQIVRNVETITESIAKGEGTLGGLVKRDELYQEARLTMSNIRQAVEKINNIADTMQKCSRDVHPVVLKVQKVADNLTTLLKQIQAFTLNLEEWRLKTDNILSNFSIATQQMRQASYDLPPLTSNLRRASKEALEVIEAAKRSWLIRKYLKLPSVKKKENKLKKLPLNKFPWENTPKQWWE